MSIASTKAKTPKCSKTPKERLHDDFSERVRSLIADGYCLRVRSEQDGFLFARLKHMSNGNEVKLYAAWWPCVLEQYTNKVLVHQQLYE